MSRSIYKASVSADGERLLTKLRALESVRISVLNFKSKGIRQTLESQHVFFSSVSFSRVKYIFFIRTWT